MKPLDKLRVAIVHDWLTGMRGGERCLEVFCSIFPQADIYTIFYTPEKITPLINKHHMIVSSLQKLPGVANYYRYLLPFFPYAIRNLQKKLHRQSKKQRYDLLLSISHCGAKNIVAPATTPHLCYCLTPMRYIWDQYEAYFSKSKLRYIVKYVAYYLRRWDLQKAQGVDHFIGISDYIGERIKRTYHRKSDILYPPVRNDWIQGDSPVVTRGDFFLSAGALVPYKNVQLTIEAFNKLKLPLVVAGDGPEQQKLKKIAKENISFLGHVSDSKLASLFKQCRALVFAAEEDFGMIPVEVQAAGRPVIALAKGGALETVVGDGPDRTGVFFSEVSTESLIQGIEYFLDHEHLFTVDNCLKQAEKFSLKIFVREFQQLLIKYGIENVEKARTAV